MLKLKIFMFKNGHTDVHVLSIELLCYSPYGRTDPLIVEKLRLKKDE